MPKTLTVDEALGALIKAKNTVGGNAVLVLSLTDSGISDCNVNDIVIIQDVDNAYVEVQARHDELNDIP